VRPIGNASIAAGGLTLRPWEPADVAFVYHACQDVEVERWMSMPRPFTAGDAVRLLELSDEGRAKNVAARFAITATETGEVLGSIGLKEIDWGASRAEADYWVAPEARGRGVAPLALQALVSWAGQHLGVREVKLQIAAGNRASERVAEQAGFARDGVVAGGCHVDDAVHDAVIYRRATT
jgi:RimJ/RimL family protein N-acetyltransferase